MLTLSNYISAQKKYSFLTGAGISYDSPSNLPLAKDIVYETINTLSIDEEIKDQIKNNFEKGVLRFEQFMELITDIFDPDLNILNQLSICNSPNLIHYLMAEFIKGKHSVFTTNFDCLIEKAGINIGVPIRSVFSNDHNISEETGAVWKLHGSLQDETGKDTKKSIVATIERLGQSGEAFSNNPFLKDVFVKSILRNDLIVIGYSGSDDYDIMPMLSQVNTPNKIFWVLHDNNLGQIKVLPYHEFYNKNMKDTFEKLFSFGNWIDSQLYVIIGNTSKIVVDIGKIISYKYDFKHHLKNEYKVQRYYYSKWNLKYAIEDWRNISFIGNYFLTIGNYEEAYRYFTLTLSMAEDTKEIFPKLYVLNKLSKICIKCRQPQLAMGYLEEIDYLLNQDHKSSYFLLKQKVLNLYENFRTNYYQHLAICYTEIGNLESALGTLHKANPKKGTIEYARKLYEKARIMYKKESFTTARSLIEKAISIHRKCGNLESLTICLTFLTDELSKLHEFDKVKEYLNEIISICKITNNHELLTRCQKRLKNI